MTEPMGTRSKDQTPELKVTADYKLYDSLQRLVLTIFFLNRENGPEQDIDSLIEDGIDEEAVSARDPRFMIYWTTIVNTSLSYYLIVIISLSGDHVLHHVLDSLLLHCQRDLHPEWVPLQSLLISGST